MESRKRSLAEFSNGGLKKSKTELDSLQSGIGSKSKPCTKFFSITGCPFGESCHFLHYVPGGYNAVAQMMNLPPIPSSKPAATPVPAQNISSPPMVKSKICNKYKTAEGCKYGDKCHFAHGEWELGKPIASSQNDLRIATAIPGHFGLRPEPSIPSPASSFGASATAKISVDASLAGAVIGRGGANSKNICRLTGVKLSVRDHEVDPSLKNIELEGTLEQIQQASAMVRELIVSLGAAAAAAGPRKSLGGPAGPGSNFKTKLCENFAKGSCTFGDRCHFAHGAVELRKTGI